MEVYRRAAPAPRSRRSPHTHDRASRRTPACPPRHTHPHPRVRAHELASPSSISLLRLHAAFAALTSHNTHSTLHAGRSRTPRALTLLLLATASATYGATGAAPGGRGGVAARHGRPATPCAYLLRDDPKAGGGLNLSSRVSKAASTKVRTSGRCERKDAGVVAELCGHPCGQCRAVGDSGRTGGTSRHPLPLCDEAEAAYLDAEEGRRTTIRSPLASE